jgi:DNA-binding transcriptional LysR family regulator
LAELERLINATLFLRHARGLTLSATGHSLLPLARKMMALIDETATHASALASGASSVVRLAAISAAVGGFLPDALATFAELHPGITVILREADAARQAAMVAEDDVDGAICRQPAVVPTGWHFTALRADRFAVVAAPSHPWREMGRVPVAELAAARWLITPSGVAARDAFDLLFRTEGLTPPKYNVITNSPTMVWRLLTKEPLIALLPVSLVGRLLFDGLLVEVPCELKFPPLSDIGILTPTDDGHAATTQLRDFLVGALRAFRGPSEQEPCLADTDTLY